MPTKAKKQGSQKKEEQKVVVKNKTTRKRKARGDKLNTLELSDDGFTTDEESDEGGDNNYETCKHFEVQTDHHEHLKHDSPRKKQKTSNVKSTEVKSNKQGSGDKKLGLKTEVIVEKGEVEKHLKRKRTTKSKTTQDDGKTSQSVVNSEPDPFGEVETKKAKNTTKRKLPKDGGKTSQSAAMNESDEETETNKAKNTTKRKLPKDGGKTSQSAAMNESEEEIDTKKAKNTTKSKTHKDNVKTTEENPDEKVKTEKTVTSKKGRKPKIKEPPAESLQHTEGTSSKVREEIKKTSVTGKKARKPKGKVEEQTDEYVQQTEGSPSEVRVEAEKTNVTGKKGRKLKAKVDEQTEESPQLLEGPSSEERDEIKTDKIENASDNGKKGIKLKAKIEKQPDESPQQIEGMSSQEKKGEQQPKVETSTSDTNLQDKEEEQKDQVVSDSKIPSKKEDLKEYTKFVGAHVSISGGLYKSVLEAEDMKARAFGLFLRSQRQWAAKPLEDKVAEKFKETCQEYGFSPEQILPHGSYLMNCGSPDESNLQKSRDLLVEELQRCEKLGLTLFNFHPGSTCGKTTVEQCVNDIAESINLAHSKTNNVITVIENMCCQGHTIGGKFEELRGIIDKVEDKSRIGVCLDTCHAFAAGFDLSTKGGFEEMMSDFDEIIGFKYLKAMHLNDSKGTLGCHLDRHENIGKGHIGKEGFKRIMNHPQLDNIPMILETPCPEDNTYAKEVKMLYSMCDT